MPRDYPAAYGLSANARAAAGVPAPGAIPAASGADAAAAPGIAELLAALRSGQVSAGSLLQLLALISGLGAGGLPTAGGGGAEESSPVEAAFLGG